MYLMTFDPDLDLIRAPVDKKDLTIFCNMLSYTHLKRAKNRNFYSHSKRVHSCVMHSSISYLLNLLLFWATITWLLPWQPYYWGNNNHKMLGLSWKQGSTATKFIHFEEKQRKSIPTHIFGFRLCTVPSCSSLYKQKGATLNDVMMFHDVLKWRSPIDLIHYTTFKACGFFIFHDRPMEFSEIVLHGQMFKICMTFKF